MRNSPRGVPCRHQPLILVCLEPGVAAAVLCIPRGVSLAGPLHPLTQYTRQQLFLETIILLS